MEGKRAGSQLASPPTRYTLHAKPGQTTGLRLLHQHHSPGLNVQPPTGSFSVLLQNRGCQVGILPGASRITHGEGTEEQGAGSEKALRSPQRPGTPVEVG